LQISGVAWNAQAPRGRSLKFSWPKLTLPKPSAFCGQFSLWLWSANFPRPAVC
jgi:hypothetical protein